ncbi:MAG: hypothetical protein L3K05_05615 [Thermoplasmata archaeon]|nr:hypothetical protein [Thermoplasmata archaeon]
MSRLRRPRALAALLAVALLAGGALLTFAAVPLARATPSFGPLTGSIEGPVNVGQNGNATYTVNVSGGQAVASNGTQVGIYSYNASVAGPNTSSVLITPATGSIQGGTAQLTLKVGNITEVLTISVLVTSSYAKQQSTTNLSYSVNVVVPYRFAATLVVGSGSTVSPFSLNVLLDGQSVGSVSVGTLASGTRFPFSFSYVNPNLSPGWHTFSVSLAQEHGLVSFVGGSESVSQSFYVSGPPPNDTVWYVAGVAAFVGVVFIFTTRVAAGRRTRPKK